jgi:hypothetical protein
MTNQHPITPPPELVQQWARENFASQYLCTQAARWGADQELEACVEWVSIQLNCTDEEHLVPHLCAARRPKPPSLKEQAFTAMLHLQKAAETNMDTIEAVHIICRALKQLPND